MTFEHKINLILDSADHFTSIMIYFTIESELSKMTSDVIMTSYFRYGSSYGKRIVIFEFSVSNHVYLLTFGKKNKIFDFCQFSGSGTQSCKELNDSSSDIFVQRSSSFMSSSFFNLLNAFSVPNYIYLVTGREIKFANFESLEPLTGTQPCQVLRW